MAAAIMATMQLARPRAHTRLSSETARMRGGKLRRMSVQAGVRGQRVHQSGLVIDKIPPQSRDLGASGTLVAAVEHMRLNCASRCSHKARWQQHNRAISVLPALRPFLHQQTHRGPQPAKIESECAGLLILYGGCREDLRSGAQTEAGDSLI